MFDLINPRSATVLALACLVIAGVVLEPMKGHQPLPGQRAGARGEPARVVQAAPAAAAPPAAAFQSDDFDADPALAAAHGDAAAAAPIAQTPARTLASASAPVASPPPPALRAAASQPDAVIGEGYRGASVPLARNSQAQARQDLGEDLSAILP